MHEPALATLLVGAIVALAIRWKHRAGAWDANQWLLAMFAATLALHVQYAATGWLFRYDAYLVSDGPRRDRSCCSRHRWLTRRVGS